MTPRLSPETAANAATRQSHPGIGSAQDLPAECPSAEVLHKLLQFAADILNFAPLHRRQTVHVELDGLRLRKREGMIRLPPAPPPGEDRIALGEDELPRKGMFLLCLSDGNENLLPVCGPESDVILHVVQGMPPGGDKMPEGEHVAYVHKGVD